MFDNRSVKESEFNCACTLWIYLCEFAFHAWKVPISLWVKQSLSDFGTMVIDYNTIIYYIIFTIDITVILSPPAILF